MSRVENQNCATRVFKNFYDNAEVYNGHDGNENNLRTIEAAQIVQKLKNNEARPKFTGCYKKQHVSK